MYLHLTFVESAISHRLAPKIFCSLVDKVIDKYVKIEEAEDELNNELFSYCTDFNLASHVPPSTSTFRRYFRILMSSFRLELQRLDSFESQEETMTPQTHESYLKSVAITEVIGHLIINPLRIRFNQRNCTDCDPYYIQVNPDFASPWACKVVKRIDIPENDRQTTFRFGVYNPQTRDFE